MKKKMMMLIAFAGSAKTIIEYSGCDGEGQLFVPREWMVSLVELAEEAVKEYEEF